MASINSSHSGASVGHATSFLLRLRIVDGSSAAVLPEQVFALYDYKTSSQTLDLVDDGVVSDEARYIVDLLTVDDLGDVDVWFGVGGEEPAPVLASRISLPQNIAGRTYQWYCIEPRRDGGKIFSMALGFSFVELRLHMKDDDTYRALFTKDIPCVSRHEQPRRLVPEMLEELGATGSDEVLGWMLRPAQEQGLSLVLGSVVDATPSFLAYLALAERVLATFETNLSYLRLHAHCRTVRQPATVSVAQVRSLGRRELDWVARNPSMLMETAPGSGLPLGSKTYTLRKVRTEAIYRDYDNRENRGLMAFLQQMASSLTDICRQAQESIADLERIEARLSAHEEADKLGLSRVVVESCLQRESPLVDRARGLRREAQRLLRLYCDALPGVRRTSYRLPARTKVFQEVEVYARFYQLMLAWESVGDFTLARDGLLLHTYRIDVLYEYYVLYRLLSWFACAGFTPDASEDAISQVSYSLRAPYFANEQQVANRYTLVRGRERVRLFYQPVAYGDEREEGGFAWHRTARAVSGEGAIDSYWLPDYLLEYEYEGRHVRVVLDAKFTDVAGVNMRKTDGRSSVFWGCFDKYCGAMVDADGRRADALWLLCGRMDERVIAPLQDTTWVSHAKPTVSDGVCALSPCGDALDELFALIGISRFTSDEVDTDCGEDSGGIDGSLAALPGDALSYRAPSVVLPVGSEMAPEATDDSKATPEPKSALDLVPASDPVPASVPGLDSASKSVLDPVPKDIPTSPTPPEDPRWGDTRGQSTSAGPELGDEVLALIHTLCDVTRDARTLCSAVSAQHDLGLNRPLLRKKLPAGREGRFYTTDTYELADGAYHVYRRWLPPELNRLRERVHAIERSRAKSEGPSRCDAKEAAAKPAAPKAEVKRRSAYAPFEQVKKLIVTLASDVFTREELCSKKFSHDTFGLNVPVLLPADGIQDDASYRTVEIGGVPYRCFARWGKFNAMRLRTYATRWQKRHAPAS